MSDSPIDRRKFLKVASAAAAGGIVLAACDDEDPFALVKPPVPGEKGWTKGEERWLSTACAQCAAGCGVKVRVVEARAVKIEGHPACPINRGGIGPRGLSGTQVLYDPDRIRQPLRRKGKRGEASFEPISWDDALDLLAERLQELRGKNESHRVGIIAGRSHGIMLELWRRLAKVYGTPNFFDGLSSSHGVEANAVWATQGVRDMPAYDWSKTRYILSLGSGILESTCQLLYFARAQAHLRRGEPGVRATIIHAGSSFSRTAMNADEWVPVKPATLGTFAMGLAHVLVRDGLHDKKFVDEHCFGFSAWKDKQGREHKGFREVLEQYTPEFVAETCGTKPSQIEDIAKSLAALSPSFVITGEEALSVPGGLHTAMAVQALNALLGAIDRPGGLVTQRPAPLADWPEAEPDEMARKALEQPRLDGVGISRFPASESVMDALPGAIAAGAPYSLDTLLLYYSNPLYSRVAPQRWRESLEKVPFIVSFTPFMDETASEVADLILPDHTYLERWEDSASAPSVGYGVFGLRQPVVEPLYDTRPTGDVVIQLAARMGDPLSGAFAWKDFKDALFKRLIGIFKAQRGSIVEAGGGAFLKRLAAEGFWSDDAYEFGKWDEVLKTPSGKFEFYSQNLEASIDAISKKSGKSTGELLERWGVEGGMDEACMPGARGLAPNGEESRYPYVLIPFTPNTYAEGSGANLPLLQELVPYTGRPTWNTEIQIHPEVAGKLGIRNRDKVVVESPTGSIEVIAYVNPGITAESVRIPRGGGHTAFGRFAKGWGANVMKLLDGEPDPLCGSVPMLGTRVSIRRRMS